MIVNFDVYFYVDLICVGVVGFLVGGYMVMVVLGVWVDLDLL